MKVALALSCIVACHKKLHFSLLSIIAFRSWFCFDFLLITEGCLSIGLVLFVGVEEKLSARSEAKRS